MRDAGRLDRFDSGPRRPSDRGSPVGAWRPPPEPAAAGPRAPYLVAPPLPAMAIRRLSASWAVLPGPCRPSDSPAPSGREPTDVDPALVEPAAPVERTEERSVERPVELTTLRLAPRSPRLASGVSSADVTYPGGSCLGGAKYRGDESCRYPTRYRSGVPRRRQCLRPLRIPAPAGSSRRRVGDVKRRTAAAGRPPARLRRRAPLRHSHRGT